MVPVVSVTGGARSLKEPWHPFLHKKMLIYPHVYKWIDILAKWGDFKLILACIEEWSFSLILDYSFRLCCFADLGEHNTLSTLTHWRPEHLIQWCLYCSAFPGSQAPHLCKLIPEYINVASQYLTRLIAVVPHSQN